MSNTSYHLAIDLGATSGRAVLASFDGEAIATEEIARFKYPMMPLSGHLFWNLPRIYEEVLRSMKRAAEIAAERNMSLSSIGIDSWGCDVAYFYNDGAIAGLHYCYRHPYHRSCRKILFDVRQRPSLR